MMKNSNHKHCTFHMCFSYLYHIEKNAMSCPWKPTLIKLDLKSVNSSTEDVQQFLHTPTAPRSGDPQGT